MDHHFSEASVREGWEIGGGEPRVDNFSSLIETIYLLIRMILHDLLDQWLHSDASFLGGPGLSHKDKTEGNRNLDRALQTRMSPYKYSPTDWG